MHGKESKSANPDKHKDKAFWKVGDDSGKTEDAGDKEGEVHNTGDPWCYFDNFLLSSIWTKKKNQVYKAETRQISIKRLTGSYGDVGII